MYVGTFSRKGRLHVGGNERLRYKIELPLIDGFEAMNTLYCELADNCELFCKERLLGELAERRGSGRCFYELTFRVTHNDGKTLSLILRARLVGGEDGLSERVWAMNWSLRDGQIIPPKLLVKHYRKKGQKIRPEKDIFLDDGELATLKNCETKIF